jgi:hypothetical protein
MEEGRQHRRSDTTFLADFSCNCQWQNDSLALKNARGQVVWACRYSKCINRQYLLRVVERRSTEMKFIIEQRVFMAVAFIVGARVF